MVSGKIARDGGNRMRAFVAVALSHLTVNGNAVTSWPNGCPST